MNPNWEICQWIDYCTGPEEEGVVQDTPYATRWGCFLDREAGFVTYGIGSVRNEAPTDLFPTALNGAVAISLSFDQLAEPVFAIGFSNGTTEVRRYVVGVPTTYTFDGITPRLLFNGILLPQDSSDTDVVCYYVKDGTVKSRYQRDNFGTEYAASNFPFEVRAIKKVDTKEYREIVYLQRIVDTFFTENWAMRSPVYPLPPIFEEDGGEVDSRMISGRLLDIIVDGGDYTDGGELDSEFIGGELMDIIVPVSASDPGSLNSLISSGAYTLVVINGGSYLDPASVNSVIIDGRYALVIINGGSYSEPTSIDSQMISGSYYT